MAHSLDPSSSSSEPTPSSSMLSSLWGAATGTAGWVYAAPGWVYNSVVPRSPIEAMVASAEKRAGRQADTYLVRSYAYASSLLNAIKNPQTSVETLEELQFQLKTTLTLLNRDQATIFKEKPLHQEDAKNLSDLISLLDSLNEENLKNPDFKQQLNNQLFVVCLNLENHISEEDGVLPKVDRLVQQSLSRVEQAPAHMIDHVLGRPVVSSAPSYVPSIGSPPAVVIPEGKGKEEASSENEAESKTSIGSFLTGYLTIGAGMLSAQTSSFLVTGLIFGLENALASIEGKGDFEQAEREIKKLIKSIKELGPNPSFQDLKPLIEGCINAFDHLNIYVNDFRIPKMGTEASNAVEDPEDLFSIGLDALGDKKSLEPSLPQEIEEVNWKSSAQEEKEKFVKNTARYYTLQFIYERFCGLDAPEDINFYSEILAITADCSNDPSESENSMQEAFFKDLEIKGVSPLKLFFARWAYAVVFDTLHHFTEKLSSAYLDKTLEFIKKHRNGEFAELKSDLVVNFSRFLELLLASYIEIQQAGGGEIGGNLSEEVQKRLETQTKNRGYTKEELYSIFAEDLIRQCTGGFFSAWILRRVLGHYPSRILDQLIGISLNSIKDDRGHTHALNCIIILQLKKLLKILKTPSSIDEEAEPAPPKKEPSEAEKERLKTLVENLFNIFKVHRHKNIQALQSAVRDPSAPQSLMEQLSQAGEDTEEFFKKKLLESMATTLDGSIESLVTEDQLEYLTYVFTSLMNQMYATGKGPTIEEKANAEKELNDLIDEILKLSIERALTQEDAGVQQERINRSIERLKTKTQTYVESAEQNLQEMEALDAKPPEFSAKLALLVEQSRNFCIEASRDLEKIGKTPLTKKLADALTPLVQEIGKMKSLHEELEKELENLKRSENILSFAQNFHTEIQKKLLNSSSAKGNCRRIEEIRKNIQKVLESYGDEETKENLLGYCNQLQTAIKALEKIDSKISHIESCKEAIRNISAERIEAFQYVLFPKNLKMKIDALKLQIEKIEDVKLKNQLLAHLSSIEKAQISKEVDDASNAFEQAWIPYEEILGKEEDHQLAQINTQCQYIQKKIADSFLIEDCKREIEGIKEEIASQITTCQELCIPMKGMLPPSDLVLQVKERALALREALLQTPPPPNVKAKAQEVALCIDSKEFFEGIGLGKTSEPPQPILNLFILCGLIDQNSSFTQQKAIEAIEAIDSFVEWIDLQDAFKPQPFISTKAIPLDGFKQLVGNLIFDRIKNHSDGLKSFIKDPNVLRFGLIHHLFLIPYVRGLSLS